VYNKKVDIGRWANGRQSSVNEQYVSEPHDEYDNDTDDDGDEHKSDDSNDRNYDQRHFCTAYTKSYSKNEQDALSRCSSDSLYDFGAI